MTLLALGSSMFPMTLGLLITLVALISSMFQLTLGLLINLEADRSTTVVFFSIFI